MKNENKDERLNLKIICPPALWGCHFLEYLNRMVTVPRKQEGDKGRGWG